MPLSPLISSLLHHYLTLDEKLSLLSGITSSNNFYTGQLPSIPRLHIPSLRFNDGPQGFRSGPTNTGTSTQFPCNLGVAATWSHEIAREYGSAVGQEFRIKDHGEQLLQLQDSETDADPESDSQQNLKSGIVILGPGLNLHRNPLGGRNHEYLTAEEPILGAEIGRQVVKGIQEKPEGTTEGSGTISCPKHWLANSQEKNRMMVNEVINDKVIKNMYSYAFRRVIESSSDSDDSDDPDSSTSSSGAGCIMCGYNQINSQFSCSNHHLLTGVLKNNSYSDTVTNSNYQNQDFFVVSDWFATHSTVTDFNAGLDVEMPYSIYFTKENFKKGLESDSDENGIQMQRIDDAAGRVLRVMERVGMLERTRQLIKDGRVKGPDDEPDSDVAGHLKDQVFLTTAQTQSQKTQTLLIQNQQQSDYFSPANLISQKQSAKASIKTILHGTILLKNKNFALPLDPTYATHDDDGNSFGNSIITFGCSADDLTVSGKGSGQVIPLRVRGVDQSVATYDSRNSRGLSDMGVNLVLEDYIEEVLGFSRVNGTSNRGQNQNLNKFKENVNDVNDALNQNEQNYIHLSNHKLKILTEEEKEQYKLKSRKKSDKEVLKHILYLIHKKGIRHFDKNLRPTMQMLVQKTQSNNSDSNSKLKSSYNSKLKSSDGSQSINLGTHPSNNAYQNNDISTDSDSPPGDGKLAALVCMSGFTREGVDRKSLELDHMKEQHLQTLRVLNQLKGGYDLDVGSLEEDETEAEAVEDETVQTTPLKINLNAGIPTNLINKILVYISTPGSFLTSSWINYSDAVLVSFYPGEYVGPAIALLLFGAFNPGGKLPITLPQIENQIGMSEKEYPGVAIRNQDYDSEDQEDSDSTDSSDDSNSMDQDPNNNYTPTIYYAEGPYIGYRWYQYHKSKPAFPFGYGLTYNSNEDPGLASSSDGVVSVVDKEELKIRLVESNSQTSGPTNDVNQVYAELFNLCVLNSDSFYAVNEVVQIWGKVDTKRKKYDTTPLEDVDGIYELVGFHRFINLTPFDKTCAKPKIRLSFINSENVVDKIRNTSLYVGFRGYENVKKIGKVKELIEIDTENTKKIGKVKELIETDNDSVPEFEMIVD